MDQNTVAAGEAEFDPARERTKLVNALAEAARAALEFDFMSAAVLGAIPGTEPQQYVIAGTPDGISKMLQAIAAPSPVSEAQAERRKLRDEALAAIRYLAECEHEDAQNRGKGGPGVFSKVERAQSLVVVAIDALAAPTAKEAEQASADRAPDAWMLEFDDERVVTADPKEVETWATQHDNPYEVIPLFRGRNSSADRAPADGAGELTLGQIEEIAHEHSNGKNGAGNYLFRPLALIKFVRAIESRGAPTAGDGTTPQHSVAEQALPTIPRAADVEEALERYGTGVLPWSCRIPVNQPLNVIADAMQWELNDLRPLVKAARAQPLSSTAATQPEQANIKTWMHRLGPDYNDSKEPTAHEIAMEAEIEDLRAALAIPASTAPTQPEKPACKTCYGVGLIGGTSLEDQEKKFCPDCTPASRAASEQQAGAREAFEDRHAGYEFPSAALRSGAYDEFAAGYRAALTHRATTAADQQITANSVEWVVNDLAELGVKIGNQFFFLYKGDSLQYETGMHDDGTPIRWRPVGKREFGECCYPVKFYKEGAILPRRYTDELVYTLGLSFGRPGDADWRNLPPAADQQDAAQAQAGDDVRKAAIHAVIDHMADNWPMKKYALEEIEARLRAELAAHAAPATSGGKA